MIGLIFASPQEAAPFLAQYTEARFDALEKGSPVQVGNVLVAVTGIGKIKATLGAERMLQQYEFDVLLHVGGCTGLTDKHDVGTVVGIDSVLEGDHVDLESPTYPRMPLAPPSDTLPEGTLVTRDAFSEDSDERSYWERLADIRDSTGYAIAYVAAQHGTPCHIAKVITTRLDAAKSPEADDEEQAYHALASFLQEWIDTTEADPAG